jgi:predicted ABC-type transport system involved in lysophospholipase L1 biosynthesis ATPase subunit
MFDRQRRERQMTVVMVTHDATVASAAERRLELRDGRLYE